MRAPSNWNGRAYRISRSELAALAGRADAAHAGAYFPMGRNDENADTVYAGEAARMLTRLRPRLQSDEVWSERIAVISKDNLPNKAHAKYLEQQFYKLAVAAGRAVARNGNAPARAFVPEYDEAMLAEFIGNAKLPVIALGHKTFDSVGGERDAPQRPRSGALRKGRAIPKLTWRGPSAENRRRRAHRARPN